ncbi:MAG: P-type conjugative transfer protein TrbG [Halothiobacillus sp. 24-54-40]|jgi:type IV secretion system protein VirB9|nr:P-type conjugative transfer protein TrbG [Halothiobacillaceae bacterium]OYY31429.1 MAG: P-type conjugative transfer protein TrbG [Halothiobacillus sp. 35-54-62]OYZ85207.1 MAG: P-type conjugative transfer protein TrbG [Halothiobacillus sp. 24-54-40]OZA79006.1 MAG: P-type conjugative transfer protein TrbG [Halothiobacillus sp. 39-53-45]HQS03972.1 P-type conjugative transfer protein TrbG [Halothiobacillus sp.]
MSTYFLIRGGALSAIAQAISLSMALSVTSVAFAEPVVPAIEPAAGHEAPQANAASVPSHLNITPLPIPRPAVMASGMSERFLQNPKAIPAQGRNGQVTFVFGQSVPTITCTPLRICDISLEPGEVINGAPQMGDTVRWQVAPAVSGEGEDKITHVIIKPTDVGLDTNMVIPTNRRTYYLRLVSDKKDFVTSIGFTYPDTQAKQWAAYQSGQAKKAAVVIDKPAVSVDQLDFNYTVKSVKGKGMVPVRIFNDGQKVFIQMPRDMQEAPALFIVGQDGKDQLVNYRLRDGYFIVDRLFNQAALIAGIGDDQSRITITHHNHRVIEQAKSDTNWFLDSED